MFLCILPLYVHELSGMWFIEPRWPNPHSLVRVQTSWGESFQIPNNPYCFIIDYETDSTMFSTGAEYGRFSIKEIRKESDKSYIMVIHYLGNENYLYYRLHLVSDSVDTLWIENLSNNPQGVCPTGRQNIYYKLDSPPLIDMSDYKTTNRTAVNLRIRFNGDLFSKIAAVLPAGTDVQVLETGDLVTIDGITAPWVRVLSSTGYTGWCFGGYLEKIKP
jgi:hypothetical protein